MLILTRRINESVDLIDKRSGERVGTVTILGSAQNGVFRVGFDCPAHVKIERDNIKRREGDGTSKDEVQD
jgi:carbon storage regulator CsrA